MRFACRVQQVGPSEWLARHAGPDVGEVQARGNSQEEALEKIAGELRYRLELCPCTGATYQHIDIEIVPEPSGP